MNDLIARLEQSCGDTPSFHVPLGPRGYMGLGFETVTEDQVYHWDGMARGGVSDKPAMLFQFSLCGRGIFQTQGGAGVVLPGQAFCAKIPSVHSYYRDPKGGCWRFFWIMVYHEYVAGRLLRQADFCNTILDCTKSPRMIEAALELFAMASGDGHDCEKRLFCWMLELERHAFRERHPEEERSRILDATRKYVLERLESPLTVLDLARRWKMTRSNFSHHFRKVTGQSPAAYIRMIRLEEAAKRIQGGKDSVKEVAAKTGFADANHLCKCFRTHFRMSPGTYRRVMASNRTSNSGVIPP